MNIQHNICLKLLLSNRKTCHEIVNYQRNKKSRFSLMLQDLYGVQLTNLQLV